MPVRKIEAQAMSFTLHHGDCLDVLRGMADNSIDSIVTDPPYGLSFMGKKWLPLESNPEVMGDFAHTYVHAQHSP